jgi:hypothetical protein
MPRDRTERDRGETEERPKRGGGAAASTRDYFVRSITHKVLSLAMDELRKDDTQRTVRQHIVDPLIKMLHTQLMPYLLLAAVVVIAILLMSMMTLTLSALFYFRH